MTIAAVLNSIDTTPGTTPTSASTSYTSGVLYAVAVTQYRTDSTEPPDPTLAGWDATWVEVPVPNGYWDQTASSMRKVSLFVGTPGSSSSGVLTATVGSAPSWAGFTGWSDTTATGIGQVWGGPVQGTVWAASTLFEQLNVTPQSTASRLCALAEGNTNNAATSRMELSSDSGDPGATWTSGTSVGNGSSPTGAITYGFLNADASTDQAPGFWHNTGGNSTTFVMVFEFIYSDPDILFVGAGTVADSSGLVGTTGHTPGLPDGLAEDDVMILVSHRNDDVGAFDTPSGWTKIDALSSDDWEVAASAHSSLVCYRVAGASESAPAVTHTDTASEQWASVIVAYRGVDTTTPLDLAATSSHALTFSNKATTNVDVAQPITTVTDFAKVVLIEVVTHNDITSGAISPSGYTNRVWHAGHQHRQILIDDKTVASAGTETPGAAGYTSNNAVAESTHVTLALRPAVTATDATVTPATVAATATLPPPAVVTGSTVVVVTVAATVSIGAATVSAVTPTEITGLLALNDTTTARVLEDTATERELSDTATAPTIEDTTTERTLTDLTTGLVLEET